MDYDNLPTFEVLPKHVGVIMDGNGRWAKKRDLPRYKGHIEGAKTFRKIGEFAADLGIKYITFYAFSTENWKRPKEEVSAIMNLFREYLKEALGRVEEDRKNGIRISFIGSREGIPADIRLLMKQVERIGRKEDRIMLNIAVNYGGRQEIAESVREIAEDVKKGKIKPSEIDMDTISSHLYTAGMPDPDLIIRPSGEQRLSNFYCGSRPMRNFGIPMFCGRILPKRILWRPCVLMSIAAADSVGYNIKDTGFWQRAENLNVETNI